MGGVLSHGSHAVDPVYNADSRIITAPLHHRCSRKPRAEHGPAESRRREEDAEGAFLGPVFLLSFHMLSVGHLLQIRLFLTQDQLITALKCESRRKQLSHHHAPSFNPVFLC